MTAAFIAIAAVVVILLFLVSASIRVAREYERGVIFRLGRLNSPPKGPGLFFLIPVIDELLSERDKINAILQEIIDEATSPWGIKVSIVEVKDVEIPSGMQRAMARQAEAERERRAEGVNAEGEFQASERLKDAALVIEAHPIALQLRYLQTLLELGSSQSTTIVFPAPLDLLRPFLDRTNAGARSGDS